MKLVDDRMKKGLAEKAAESMNIPTDEFDKSDVYSQLVPGPYKLEYCKKLLSELLKSQKKVRKNGPDPNMDLIKEEELHEIQRIWRMERGDWKNSVYAIYEKVMGEKLSPPQEDLGGFGSVEQEILEQICNKNNVPTLLVSKLLNEEFDSQGMTKHSQIYPKLNKILGEEWREIGRAHV